MRPVLSQREWIGAEPGIGTVEDDSARSKPISGSRIRGLNIISARRCGRWLRSVRGRGRTRTEPMGRVGVVEGDSARTKPISGEAIQRPNDRDDKALQRKLLVGSRGRAKPNGAESGDGRRGWGRVG